jgi:hypothetical protein
MSSSVQDSATTRRCSTTRKPESSCENKKELLALFVGLALMDTEAYKPKMIEGFAPDIQR